MAKSINLPAHSHHYLCSCIQIADSTRLMTRTFLIFTKLGDHNFKPDTFSRLSSSEVDQVPPETIFHGSSMAVVAQKLKRVDKLVGNGVPAYMVRKILEVRHQDCGFHYLVDWERYSLEERSWISRNLILHQSLHSDFY